MASEAQIKGKQLADELAKPVPDEDVLYALRSTQHLWNTIDNDKIRRGLDKLERPSLVFEPIAKLAGKKDLRKIGSIFGVTLMVDMTDLPPEERDDRYYRIRRAYDDNLGIKVKQGGSEKA